MPLLDDNLSIWKISFRWAGLNPDSLKYRFYIPHNVKDNMRLLLNAIHSNNLFCRGLQPKILFEKSNSRNQNKLNKIHEILSDGPYDRNFMLSHSVWRADFAHWCNRNGMPYPEFWFPIGWTIHELNHLDMLIHENPELKDSFPLKTVEPLQSIELPPPIQNEEAINQSAGKRSITNEEVWKPVTIAAKTIWSDKKTLAIAEVVRMIKGMDHLKASAFTESAIRKRIASLSPVPGKPGRKPRKKIS